MASPGRTGPSAAAPDPVATETSVAILWRRRRRNEAAARSLSLRVPEGGIFFHESGTSFASGGAGGLTSLDMG